MAYSRNGKHFNIMSNVIHKVDVVEGIVGKIQFKIKKIK